MKHTKTIIHWISVVALVFLLGVIDYLIIFFPDKECSKYKYSVDQRSIALQGDVYNVNEITEELEQYISDYCKYDMAPIYGSYKLTDNEGTAMIAFINKDHNGSTSLEFNINTQKKCVTSVKYIKGQAMKAPDYSSSSFNFDGTNIYDEYQKCLSENPDCSKAYFFLSNSNIDVFPVCS